MDQTNPVEKALKSLAAIRSIAEPLCSLDFSKGRPNLTHLLGPESENRGRVSSTLSNQSSENELNLELETIKITKSVPRLQLRDPTKSERKFLKTFLNSERRLSSGMSSSRRKEILKITQKSGGELGNKDFLSGLLDQFAIAEVHYEDKLEKIKEFLSIGKFVEMKGEVADSEGRYEKVLVTVGHLLKQLDRFGPEVGVTRQISQDCDDLKVEYEKEKSHYKNQLQIVKDQESELEELNRALEIEEENIRSILAQHSKSLVTDADFSPDSCYHKLKDLRVQLQTDRESISKLRDEETILLEQIGDQMHPEDISEAPLVQVKKLHRIITELSELAESIEKENGLLQALDPKIEKEQEAIFMELFKLSETIKTISGKTPPKEFYISCVTKVLAEIINKSAEINEIVPLVDKANLIAVLISHLLSSNAEPVFIPLEQLKEKVSRQLGLNIHAVTMAIYSLLGHRMVKIDYYTPEQFISLRI